MNIIRATVCPQIAIRRHANKIGARPKDKNKFIFYITERNISPKKPQKETPENPHRLAGQNGQNRMSAMKNQDPNRLPELAPKKEPIEKK